MRLVHLNESYRQFEFTMGSLVAGYTRYKLHGFRKCSLWCSRSAHTTFNCSSPFCSKLIKRAYLWRKQTNRNQEFLSRTKRRCCIFQAATSGTCKAKSCEWTVAPPEKTHIQASLWTLQRPAPQTADGRRAAFYLHSKGGRESVVGVGSQWMKRLQTQTLLRRCSHASGQHTVKYSCRVFFFFFPHYGHKVLPFMTFFFFPQQKTFWRLWLPHRDKSQHTG